MQFWSQIIANATYNAAILTLPDYDMDSSLFVGEGFKGCILQGPGILFNDSINNGAAFGPCPADNKGCKDTDVFLYLKLIHISNESKSIHAERKVSRYYLSSSRSNDYNLLTTVSLHRLPL